MPSLKDLKVRIGSVQSTRKITSAMKLVAAAKLRRAQEQAEAGRPYAERMGRVMASLVSGVSSGAGGPALLSGTGRDDVHLLVVMTADRGLCGGFNSSIVRAARRFAADKISQGKTVKILCVGRKGRDQMRRDYAKAIIGTVEDVAKPRLTFEAAESIGRRIIDMFDAGEFDVCTIVYNKFQSAITQIVTVQQLIPFAAADGSAANNNAAPATSAAAGAVYEYEPEEEEILRDLLPRNIAVQIYRALLENGASEQGARMTAMDNATRNAGDMINRLTLNYNRTRQAYITKELIEIISGAEAL